MLIDRLPFSTSAAPTAPGAGAGIGLAAGVGILDVDDRGDVPAHRAGQDQLWPAKCAGPGARDA